MRDVLTDTVRQALREPATLAALRQAIEDSEAAGTLSPEMAARMRWRAEQLEADRRPVRPIRTARRRRRAPISRLR